MRRLRRSTRPQSNSNSTTLPSRDALDQDLGLRHIACRTDVDIDALRRTFNERYWSVESRASLGR